MIAGLLATTAEARVNARNLARISNVSKSSHVPMLTKNLSRGVDSSTPLGVFYSL